MAQLSSIATCDVPPGAPVIRLDITAKLMHLHQANQYLSL